MAATFSSHENQALYQSRFCNQENFDIIFSGNHNDLANTEFRSTLRISYPDFNEIETLYSSIKYTDTEKTICERSNIWTICSKGISHKRNKTDIIIDSSGIFHDKNNQWTKLTQVPDNRVYYCVCSFMKILYAFGGYNGQSLESCLKYDTKTSKWSYIANMNSCRQNPGCTVYEGKIVVTGGYYHGNLKSVEIYDHHENKWTNLPDMIEKRCHLGVVSMGNKMFVIGGSKHLTCEVFDSSSRKFTSITPTRLMNNYHYYATSVVNIGYKVLVFCPTSSCGIKKFQIYDVLKDQWCLKENDFIEAKIYICCSKVPLV